MSSRVRSIAWREFKYTALTRAFLLGAVVFPLFVWGSFPLIIKLTDRTDPPLRGQFILIDPTGEVAEAAGLVFAALSGAEQPAPTRTRAEFAGELRRDPARAIAREQEAARKRRATRVVEVTVQTAAGTELDQLKDRLRAGSILALAVIDPRVLDPADPDTEASAPGGGAGGDRPPAVRLFTARDMHPAHVRTLRRELNEAIVRARVQRRGADLGDLRALLRPPPLSMVTLAESGEESGDTTDIKEALPFFFVALLAICAFTSGQYLLTTTIEEKSNRVMEVLLSAASPMQIMAGKILGQGLVSLVMLLMYGGLLVTGVAVFATFFVKPAVVVLFGVYFVMAYFITAATMGAIGSAVSDLHDAQSLMIPAMALLLFAPMMLMVPASQDPSGPVATIASFIPPLIPYVMVVRLTAGDVPAWQIAVSLVVGYGSMVAALWMAARVFRVGVLMYGKPPSPLELLRWMRYS